MNDHMLALLLGKSRETTQILHSVSCLSHLFLILFRANKDAFFPCQIYHDVQASVRSTLCTVARVMNVCPDQSFYFFHLGTDRLEQEFAFVRTITHSINCALLELGNGFSAASHSTRIRGSNPSWRPPSNRLAEDHNNVLSWDTGDHTSLGEGGGRSPGVLARKVAEMRRSACSRSTPLQVHHIRHVPTSEQHWGHHVRTLRVCFIEA